MKRWLIAMVGLVSVMVMVAACAPAPEKVMTPEEFYRGRVITFMCASAPGGGFDLQTRTIAPFIEKELGAKMVSVDNMSGGSGFPAMNWLYNSAPRDGSIFGLIKGEKLGLNEAFHTGDPVEFEDLRKFSVIATWGSDPNVTGLVGCSPERPWQTLLDLKAAPGTKTTATNPWASGTFGELATGMCLGLKDWSIVVGYPSTAERQTAIFRGEVDWGGTDLATAGGMIQAGMIKVLGGSGTKRNVNYPDLPCLGEVTVPGMEKWMTYRDAVTSMLRFLVAPPEIPQDRHQFLMQAFTRVTQDPEFQKVTEERFIVLEGLKIGDEALAVFEVFPSLPQSERDYIKNTLYSLLK